ncbi:hypothetical protein IFM58399_06897 [Aspergillus lentulus]|uniref:Uncharacterized protein n=1 Tax=Aspergillus lentulus TaxID=293939 RepID=A0AAN5YR49_ASPLE|nr:uncharacterized protein IFM58399_06897 [Aspergillus lentulus]KAF4156508.1 hypothetical protein CNMCM6069_006660 [Aspergillus lentulus]KAF4203980.1 hypothetical protein CNMCM8927_008021 [Aspergillus lentulus]GFF43289.1 hypothetical protein IFM58399_06897 [Aspergillus lentulus]
MSDNEGSQFVLEDSDGASVGPIPKSAEEIANLRDWRITAYLSDTSESKKHLNAHTALHYSVENNSPCDERLLWLGADVHATDTMRNTLLHFFRPSNASERTLEALMQYGAGWDVMRAENGKSNSRLKWLHADCLDVLIPYVQD